MNRPILAAVIVVMTSLSTARAGSDYLYIPAIPDSTSTPGFPGAMLLQSLTITPHGYSVIKNVDTATPKIQLAISGGTNLGTSTLLLYNSAPPPAGTPDAVLPFQNTFANSSTLLGGTPMSEQDTFSSVTPSSLYLEIPGITGPASTPGHPGVIPLQSFTLDPTDFSILKSVDPTTPTLQQDLLNAVIFPTATLLLYNSATPGPQPDAQVIFPHAVISADHLQGNNNLIEQVTFSFTNFSQPTPEPLTAALLLPALVPLLLRGRRKTSV